MKTTLLTTLLGLWSSNLTAATDPYAVPLRTIDGATANLSIYKNKTLLIVNVASKCGYTKQYAALEETFKKYQPRGLVVLGFPSNDFGGQEPGTDAEIKTFCQTKFNVTFPMYAKAPVTGADQQPLFKYLTENAPKTGEIGWNFEKFLMAPGGKVVARFSSGDAPGDKKVVAAIEAALPETPKR